MTTRQIGTGRSHLHRPCCVAGSPSRPYGRRSSTSPVATPRWCRLSRRSRRGTEPSLALRSSLDGDPLRRPVRPVRSRRRPLLLGGGIDVPLRRLQRLGAEERLDPGAVQAITGVRRFARLRVRQPPGQQGGRSVLYTQEYAANAHRNLWRWVSPASCRPPAAWDRLARGRRNQAITLGAAPSNAAQQNDGITAH